MNIEQFEQQALNLLKGLLNSAEEQEFKTWLNQDAEKSKHFNELKTIWNATKEDAIETPEESLKKGFYNMLAMHQLENTKPKSLLQRAEIFLDDLIQYKRLGQLTIALIIALTSGFIGYQFNLNNFEKKSQNYVQEVEDLNMKLANVQLKSSSTSDRIQAINALGYFSLKEEVIVEKLINKLLYDDNLHVRMAAGKSLLAFNTNAEVMPAIIKAIRAEKELLVQATLIDILITLDKNIAIKEIYRIYESESSSPEFRTIYQSIFELKNI